MDAIEADLGQLTLQTAGIVPQVCIYFQPQRCCPACGAVPVKQPPFPCLPANKRLLVLTAGGRAQGRQRLATAGGGGGPLLLW